MVLMLLVVGGIATLVGWVWIMITAFSESVPWGVGIFLFSPLAFVYGIAAHKVADAHRAAARNRSEPVADVPDEPETDAGPEQRLQQTTWPVW